MGEIKHRWRVDFNYLAGITARQWWTLLRRHRIDPIYAHRAALITGVSLMNSAFAGLENLRFGSRIAAAKEHPAPIFVLGHYRHGTTHLHNLLAQDPQVTFPSTYQVTNPTGFLGTERIATRLLGGLVPERRPQDSMKLGVSLPQEDEYAVALLTLCSPMLGLSFPRHVDHYRRFHTLRELTPGELADWKAGMRLFLRKIATRDDRPVVLKSPSHTARIRTLLELFPDAKFVHIHRDPYHVFQSTRHLFDSSVWFMYLQRPELGGLDDHILDWYVEMYDAFFEDWPTIPEDQRYEISFDDLESDPIQTLRGTYGAMGLGAFPEPELRTYLASIEGYSKNRYPALPADQREKVATRWRRCFEAWSYPL